MARKKQFKYRPVTQPLTEEERRDFWIRFKYESASHSDSTAYFQDITTRSARLPGSGWSKQR